VKLEQARGRMLSLARVCTIVLATHLVVPVVSSTCLLKPVVASHGDVGPTDDHMMQRQSQKVLE